MEEEFNYVGMRGDDGLKAFESKTKNAIIEIESIVGCADSTTTK